MSSTTTKTTVYLKTYQVVVLGILDEVSTTGVARSAIDEWLTTETDVSVRELKSAVDKIQSSDQSIEEFGDECRSLTEFINKAERYPQPTQNH